MIKCKVLYVVNAMNMGGLENFVMNIVRNIDLAKFDVEFLYCDNIKSYFDDEIIKLGFKITKITSRSSGIFKHLNELNKFFSENSFDAVHINYNSSLCFTVARAAKKSGIRNIIVHSHNSSAKKTLLHMIFKPFIAKYANMYFACSKLAAEWMFTKKILDSGEVHIIKNAIDTKKYIYTPEKKTSVKEELGLGESIVIGHIGRFNYQKNHTFIIDIFEEYYSKNNNAKLLLVGIGERFDEIKEYVNKKNLSSVVVFAGLRNDIPNILSAMDCFLMPSLFEGLPVTLVEAQAAGLRCLVSDTITKEVALTDIIDYYSIEKSAKEWADRINVTGINSEKYNEIVKKSGFDISEELKVLGKYYNLK